MEDVFDQNPVPEWLRKSWQNSKEYSLDQLSMEEIIAEIRAARKARRESESR
jgi:hypothetical protein